MIALDGFYRWVSIRFFRVFFCKIEVSLFRSVAKYYIEWNFPAIWFHRNCTLKPRLWRKRIRIFNGTSVKVEHNGQTVWSNLMWITMVNRSIQSNLVSFEIDWIQCYCSHTNEPNTFKIWKFYWQFYFEFSINF